MECEVIKGDVSCEIISRAHIQYDHIYGNVDEQKEVVTLMRELLGVREKLLNNC